MAIIVLFVVELLVEVGSKLVASVAHLSVTLLESVVLVPGRPACLSK